MWMGVVYVAMHDRRISGVQHPVRIPMVYAYAMPEDSDIPYVTYDNEHSAYQMTRLLIEQGAPPHRTGGGSRSFHHRPEATEWLSRRDGRCRPLRACRIHPLG